MRMPSVASLLFVLIIIGCQAMTGKTAGQNVDDTTITATVKSRLVGYDAANLTRIDVDTERGTVYLTGSANSEAAKTRAAEIAAQVGGVESVVNNLQVTP